MTIGGRVYWYVPLSRRSCERGGWEGRLTHKTPGVYPVVGARGKSLPNNSLHLAPMCVLKPSRRLRAKGGKSLWGREGPDGRALVKLGPQHTRYLFVEPLGSAKLGSSWAVTKDSLKRESVASSRWEAARKTELSPTLNQTPGVFNPAPSKSPSWGLLVPTPGHKVLASKKLSKSDSRDHPLDCIPLLSPPYPPGTEVA